MQANGNLAATTMYATGIQGIVPFSPLAGNETYRFGKRGFHFSLHLLDAEEVV